MNSVELVAYCLTECGFVGKMYAEGSSWTYLFCPLKMVLIGQIKIRVKVDLRQNILNRRSFVTPNVKRSFLIIVTSTLTSLGI